MTFERSDGRVFRLSEGAISTIDSYRQQTPQALEAGGILLGRILVPGYEVIADTVTVPGPADRRGRFRFSRAREPTQRIVERAWLSSDGIQNYLGEWHTHPEDDPHPSAIDLRNWERLGRTAKFEQDALFFVIAGRIEIRAWEVVKGGGTVVRLSELP